MLGLSMSLEIKFHIVIPFGGNSDFLIRTLESVVDQSYSHWDLTIIDDGTGLDLEVILERFLDKVSIVFLPEKVGIVSIFDLSIKELTGDLGMILGADDVLERDFLFHMAEAWNRNPLATLIHPRVLTINEHSEVEVGFLDRFKHIIAPTNFKSNLKGRLLIYSLISGNWMYFTSSTFNISHLKLLKFNPNLKIAMDWDLALRMAMAGYSFGYSEDAVFYYRRHGDSFSMRQDASLLRLKEEIWVIKGVRKQALKNKSIDIWLFSFFHFYSQINFLYRKLTNFIRHRHN
jgi:GT2 family glycosyltransferase